MRHPSEPKRRELIGRAAAPGLAVGPLYPVNNGASISPAPADDPARGAADLVRAIDLAISELTALESSDPDGDGAEILAFQIAMLEDETLRMPALAAINGGTPAESAWKTALDCQIADCEAAGEEYFRARSADLKDLRDRVLRGLGFGRIAEPAPPGAILIGEELTPSGFLETDWRSGGGIALAAGSATSHVAMLARARGIPMIVGLGPLDLDAHRIGAVDGTLGRLVLSPDDAQRAEFSANAAVENATRRAAQRDLGRPAMTADGTRISVMINVADPTELDDLDPMICDGIGLVRTELLFRGGALPDEEAQYETYRRILDWAAGRPVTIRTLDAGGDKPIPGLTLDGETNPFLGVRGIRLSLNRLDVFRVQLRALARAAAHGPLKVMLPMVTVPRELAATRILLAAAVAALEAEGIACRMPLLGIMVEVPAAALAIDRFDAAFYSIGSNDLTQYTMASARDIGALADLADPMNPAVLRLISEVARHGIGTGREVSLCGDIAGDPAHTAALLAAGVTCLSMAPASIGAVKTAISSTRRCHDPA